MDDEKRRLRDEVADLSRAVRELRDQLAARPSGCQGWHYHFHPSPWSPASGIYLYTVTDGSTPNVIYGSGTTTYRATNALAS